jgi:PAS domain S-box-containing protein
LNISITQRQATLFLIAAAATACGAALLRDMIMMQSFLLSMPALLTFVVVLLVLLATYYKGWEPARIVFIVILSLLVGMVSPLDAFNDYVSQVILLPPIIALVIAGPRSVAMSAILTWLILAQRVQWQGSLMAQGLSITALGAIGLVVSRLIMDTSVRTTDQGAQNSQKQAESLRLMQERYQALTANLPNSVVILFDRDLRFILVDGPEVTRSGYSREAMLGKTLYDALPEAFVKIAEPNMRGVLNGQSISAELPFSNQFYEYNYVPLRDEKGDIIYGLILGQNITARKNAEMALKRSEEMTRAFENYLKALHDVSIELSKSETFDDLCRHAVEFGRSKLGFDRLGLWFLDKDPTYEQGSFGTDEFGQTRDERQQRIFANIDFDPAHTPWNAENLLIVHEDVPLFGQHRETVGHGWQILAAFQDAGHLIGYLSADNLLNKRPIVPYQLELLTLYATTLAQLCTRKRTEEALLESERVAREFQEKLRALHELALEVSAARTLDDFFRCAVNLGVKKLGFERMSLWLMTDGRNLHGTYGYSDSAAFSDERALKFVLDDDSREIQLIKDGIHARLWDNAPLRTAGEIVGSGWDALALLWDGTKVVGLISIDNFISKQPPRAYTLDLLGLYGNLIGSLLTQKRAEEAMRISEERYRIVSEIISDYAYAYSVDEAGEIGVDWFTTESYYHITGYMPGELPLRGTYGLYQPHDQERVQSEVALVLQGQEVVGEYEINTKNGEKRWLSIHRYPVWDEAKRRVVRFYGAAQDITDRKRAEEQLKQLNIELEQRVIQRTAQLEEANQELEAFTYTVSHDLRAPLRAIDGFSHAFVQNYASSLPEKGQHYLDRIQINAQRMGELIDDLLALSRLGRQTLQRETVDMALLIREVLREFVASDETGKAEIQIVGNVPSCQGDRSLLRQVLVNLISNAIKYSAKTNQPQIEIGALTAQEATVFYVRDNGAGFDMQYVDKLFGTFQRLHSDSEFDGTGIGLAIVKRIITRHGGRVWAEGQLDKGATFYFTVGNESTPDISNGLHETLNQHENENKQEQEADTANPSD